MKRLVLFLGISFLLASRLCSEEFTVMAYNVENLFDLDRVAVFDEYEQAPFGDYGPEQLLNKLRSIHRTLTEVNHGHGPEVILFQELELDRTPFNRPAADEFLKATANCTLEEMLTGDNSCEYPVFNLPSELLLLKYLEDRGMTGYQIAQPDPFLSETHPPHKNVVFTRFPVRFIRQRPMLMARDLLVVGLDVNGSELIVMDNHWKSGASSPSIEPVRIQNARVVRAELDAILYQNPDADIIIGGDFNCYYNHNAAFPELEVTGINDVMGTHGMETRMVGNQQDKGLYNLWYEVPADQRGSEVWRGYWGTLMQLLITPGMYDSKGVQYVDNSFHRLIIPGENIEDRWGRPAAWTNFGGGSGFSDHLPVVARFRTVEPDDENSAISLVNPTEEQESPFRPKVDYQRLNRKAIPPLASISDLSDREFASMLGELFIMDQALTSDRPLKIKLGERELQVYLPVREVRDRLDSVKEGDVIRSIVELDTYRGQLQVVIAHPSWIQSD